MKDQTQATVVLRYFKILLFCAAFCMVSLAMVSISTVSRAADANAYHGRTFVPAKRLSSEFERELLNARSFFIYYVTIQKPDSLEEGLERFHNSELRLRDLTELVAQHDELRSLRIPVAQLSSDVANYGIALSSTLAIVQSGELKGDRYEVQIKEWTSRGAVVVKDAEDLDIFTLQLGEVHTDNIAQFLKDGQTGTLMMLSASFITYFLLNLLLRRKLNGFQEGKARDAMAIIEAVRPGSA